MKYKKYIMIHILHMWRTGGSSVRKAFKYPYFKRLFIQFNEHNISFGDLNLSKKDRVIIFLREPKLWYESVYRYKMQTKTNLRNIKDYPLMKNNKYEDFINDCYYRDNTSAVKKWFKPWNEYHSRAFIDNGLPIYKALYKFYLSIGEKYDEKFLQKIIRFVNVEDINTKLPLYVNKKIKLPLIKEIPKINKSNIEINYQMRDFKFEEDLNFYQYIQKQYKFI